MTNRAPSDKADKILIRLPDGMRDRLHARAEANGRSMTAEVVSMLENGLNAGGAIELEALVDEFGRLNRQKKMMEAPLADIDARIGVVMRSIRAIAAADSVGNVPEELKSKSLDLYSILTRGVAGLQGSPAAGQEDQKTSKSSALKSRTGGSQSRS